MVHIIPTIGYCVLGVTIFLGLVMIVWFPLGHLLCPRRFEKKGVIHATTKSAPQPELPDTDIPLMFKRRDAEVQPVTKQYNFEKDARADERFS